MMLRPQSMKNAVAILVSCCALSLTAAEPSFVLKSTNDWHEVQRPAILQRMQEVMGPLPGSEKRCPLDVKIEQEVDCGSFVRQFITYQSEPGGRVPAYLLIPKSASEENRAFGILTLHQTRPAGHKVVVGLDNSPNDEYAVELAQRGYVCLAPAYPLLANYAPDLKQLGYQSGTMKAIWDNIRGVDLLESLPYVERGRFGAIGHSLGGHNSLYTAATDERLKVVVTSCGFDSYRDYMSGNIKGWTSDRYMPRLFQYAPDRFPFDFHDVLGAIAPRTVFVSAPKGDTNFKWESVDRVVRAARPVYELHQASTNIVVEHPDVGHVFPTAMREKAYAMIARVLPLKR
jgi:hypothetical protein